jgi:hypothetical protein
MKDKLEEGCEASPYTPKMLDVDEGATQKKYNREIAQGTQREKTADEKPSWGAVRERRSRQG